MTTSTYWLRPLSLALATMVGLGGCATYNPDLQSSVEQAKTQVAKADAFMANLLGQAPNTQKATVRQRSSGSDQLSGDRHYALGMRYMTGGEVPRDLDRAAYHLGVAADRGNPEAQFAVATIHAFEPTDNNERAQAVRYFRLAAQQGHPQAQYRLADAYLNGFGVPQDPSEAAKWYRKAAEGGNSDASFMLANLHLLGRGVERSQITALRLFAQADRQGHPQAKRYLAVLNERIQASAPQPLTVKAVQ